MNPIPDEEPHYTVLVNLEEDGNWTDFFTSCGAALVLSFSVILAILFILYSLGG